MKAKQNAPKTPPTTRRSFWIGVVVGSAAVVLLAGILTGSGAISMEASGRMNPVDYLGQTMWESSMFWRTPDQRNPFTEDATSLEKGFESYKTMCVHCHGAPNVSRAQWARGMHPLPPDLTTPNVQQRSDGELFYITKHGIRGTGMPSFGRGHGDDDIWRIVGFVRNLGGLTEEQEATLKEAVQHFDHSHDLHQHQPDAEHGHPETRE